tara:strand:- start:404 stop:688 length:285 start_codon:yes stop_codon:yes gene_type:complete
MGKCFDFENDDYLQGYEKLQLGMLSGKDIRKLKGRQIIYVDYVDPYRGYFTPKTGIIADSHYSFIIFEDGNNVDKRDIKNIGIKKIIGEAENQE